MNPMNRSVRYPLGARIIEKEIDVDPYPTYRRLLEQEPVTWVARLGMWWVARYEHVREILQNDRDFVTSPAHATSFGTAGTFGAQMLSTEGAEHARYRNPVRFDFQPRAIRERLERCMQRDADLLIDRFAASGRTELAASFARELPIRTMLELFGLPQEHGALLRGWFDTFERSLANFGGGTGIRDEAHAAVSAFHAYIREFIDGVRRKPSGSLLSAFANAQGERLTEAEICRNALVILFGGISTVEALILNTVWTLSIGSGRRRQLALEPALLPQIVEEVIRLQAPVQSATRHVVRDVDFHGHAFRRGDVVNCMLAAANRDPAVFPNPDQFELNRPTFPRHVGFAIGTHLCLGLHLARAEAAIALRQLYGRLADLRMDPAAPSAPRGYEFNKPPFLNVLWNG